MPRPNHPDDFARGYQFRPLSRAVIFTSALVWLFAVTGCGTLHVRPPSQVDDPVEVYVIDYGRTSRLVLPAEIGGDTSDDSATGLEYAYGDWSWYAKNNDSFIDAASALLVPTLGTIGRRSVSKPGVTAEGKEGEVYAFFVSRTASNSLRDKLNATIDDPSRERVYNEMRGMEFVKLGESYWIPNQSSTEIKAWMQELGCQVKGWTLIAEFDFEQ